jgi:hypothetical protein
MDIDSIQKNLAGKLPLETLIDTYYDPDLHTTPNLFYVERKDGKALRIYQKYRE